MPQITITFEDLLDPPNPGIVRVYADGAFVCCTDHGGRPASDVQVGWKIKDIGGPWLTVLTVE